MVEPQQTGVEPVKPEREAPRWAAVGFMSLGWLFLSYILVRGFRHGFGPRTSAVEYFLVGLAVLAWVLIPIQIVHYFRQRRVTP